MERPKVIKIKRDKKYTPRPAPEPEPMPLDEASALIWARKKKLLKK